MACIGPACPLTCDLQLWLYLYLKLQGTVPPPAHGTSSVADTPRYPPSGRCCSLLVLLFVGLSTQLLAKEIPNTAQCLWPLTCTLLTSCTVSLASMRLLLHTKPPFSCT